MTVFPRKAGYFLTVRASLSSTAPKYCATPTPNLRPESWGWEIRAPEDFAGFSGDGWYGMVLHVVFIFL